MAIEFNCQFCHAIIRVPDNAGGGKGRCPKCAMRITVPRKSTVKPAAKTNVDEEPFVLPLADQETIETSSPLNFNNPTSASVPSESIVFDPTQVTKPRLGELPVDRSLPVGSIARRSKKRKRGNNTLFVIGAILLTALGAACYFASPALLTEKLSGEFIAGTSSTLDLPPVLIEKSRFQLSSDDVARLLEKLEVNPVPLISNSMQIHLSGTPQGLRVSIAAGPQAHFYRVQLNRGDAVQKFMSRHEGELEQERSKRLGQAATGFLEEYEKVLTKKSTSDSVTPFRDSLALTALVGGFGNELVAIHGRGLYRCAFEDREGGLYFLLPPGVKEFEIIGRKHTDGRVVVPADFKVKVQGEIAQAKPSEEKSTRNPSPKGTSKNDDGELNENERDGEMSGKK